jgi:peptidoglycan/LPS O-acetylase OafA/YrhL
LSFAVLALTVATFMRLRQRWAKVGALLVLETLILVILGVGGNSAIGFGGWLVLVLLALILLLGPALLERQMRAADRKRPKSAHKSSHWLLPLKSAKRN